MRYLRPAVRAFALGHYDRGEGVPEDRLAWVVEDSESFLAHAGWRTSLIFVLVMMLIEHAPVFFVGRPARFSRLSPRLRDEFLEKMDRSRFAILLALPKAICGLIYYEHPDALKETGWDGGCLMGDMPEGVGLVQLPRSKS